MARKLTESGGMYGDLPADEESLKKRVKLEPEDEVGPAYPNIAIKPEPGIEIKPEPADDVPPEAPRAVTVSEALTKIGNAMRDDKRFVKASKLYCTLLAAELSASTSEQFFAVLTGCEITQKPERPQAEQLRLAFVDVLEAVHTRIEMFGESARTMLKWWHLHIVTANAMRTDDTYAFAAAAKKATEAVTQMGGYDSRKPADFDAPAEVARRAALMACMDVAYSYYKFAWAKTSIDMLFRAAVDRRQLFDDVQAGRIEAMNSTLRARNTEVRASRYEAKMNDNFANLSAPNY